MLLRLVALVLVDVLKCCSLIHSVWVRVIVSLRALLVLVIIPAAVVTALVIIIIVVVVVPIDFN